MIREAYEHAAGLFVATTARVGETEWERPGLGEWTVRDLVGHANRALLTVETYLDKTADAIDLVRPVDYFLQAKASLADPSAVAARGREAGQALGAQPATTVRVTADRVLARLKNVSDDQLVSTPVGGMRLIDYLPSRAFELTIHTLDLAAAISQRITVPDPAMKVTLSLLADLALATDMATPLILAATGRNALPVDYTVL